MRRNIISFSILFIIACGLTQGQDAKRVPVPPKEQLAKSKALVDEIFAADFKAAATAEQKVKLAGNLMQQARDSKDDAGNRYVLFMLARELAAQAGDSSLALLAAEELGKQFDLPLLMLRAQTFAACENSIATPEAGRALVDQILPLISDAVDADEYDVALELSKVALSAAKKATSVPLVSAVEKRTQEVLAVRQGFTRLQPYLDLLKKNIRDEKANFELGSYYGLLKGKWDKALPFLALGNNAVLKQLAQQDLDNPEDAARQLDLADLWWEVAEKMDEPARLNLQRRARHWYERAVFALRGLNRTKAARRIEQVTARLIETPSEGPGGPVGQIHVLAGHTDEIKSVAISPTGRYGASAGIDNTVRVWDLTTGKPLATLRGHSKQVWGVDFHPDNRHVVSASWDGTARFWDIQTGNETKKLVHPVDVNGVAVSRDGKRVLVGCDNRNLYLWDAVSGAELAHFSGPTGYVYAVAFAPDGRHIACGSVDRSVHIYDMTSNQTVRVIQGHANGVTALAFSPDSRFVFSCGDRAAHQWEVATGKEVRRFEGHAGNVYGLAVSRDGRRLVTGGDDKTVRLWDVASGKELHTFEGHTDTVNSVAISPDGRHALTGGYDRTARFWGLPAR